MDRKEFNKLVQEYMEEYIAEELQKDKAQILDDAGEITRVKFIITFLLEKEEEYISPLYPYATKNMIKELLDYEANEFDDEVVSADLSTFDILVNEFINSKKGSN